MAKSLFMGMDTKNASAPNIAKSLYQPIVDLFKPVDKKKQKEMQAKVANAKKVANAGINSVLTNYSPQIATTTSDTLGGYSGSSGGGGYSGSSGGGGTISASPLASGIVKPDISGLLAAYDQQAESAKKTAQNTYDTTRNDLLTSLKRFQEQNAKDVENQRQNYLAAQSSLDVAREQANRQNRIAASSRGLGGSGLQQLAQLQTLMAQGEDISNAASSNQKAMDALRLALQEREDDYNTNLAKAQTTLDTALNNIDSNLAQQKAKAIFDVEQDYANTLNSLLMNSASGGGSGRGGSGSGSSDFDPVIEGLLESFNNEMQGYSGKSMNNLYRAVNNKYGTNFKKANVSTISNYLTDKFLTNLGGNLSSNMSRAYYNDVMNRTKAIGSGLQTKSTSKTKTASKTTSKSKTTTKNTKSTSKKKK